MQKCRIFLSACLVLLGTQAEAGSAIGSNQGIMWGINGHPGRGSSAVYVNIDQQMKLVNSLGVKHYRADFYSADSASFQRLRNLLSAAKPYGIVVTPIIISGSGSKESDSYTAGYNLAKAYAQNFPEVKVFEIGNEENGQLRDGFSDGSMISDWTGLANYPKIRGRLRGELEGLKAGNAQALSALGDAGGCNYGFIQALWQDGLRWDITVMHPYDFWGDIDNRGSTGTHCRGGDNMIQKHADFGKPIWLTEFNYTPAVKNSDKLNEGKGMVSMMKNFASLAKKYRIEVADIYELVDEPAMSGTERYFGVFGPNGEETDASKAIRAQVAAMPVIVYDQLPGSTSSPVPAPVPAVTPTPAPSRAPASEPPVVVSGTVEVGAFGLAAGSARSFAEVGLRMNMQKDGNLVLYRLSNGSAVWSTKTVRSCTSCQMNFQSDGNLVLYDNGKPYWSSQTYGHSGAKLKINSNAPYISIGSGSTIYWRGN